MSAPLLEVVGLVKRYVLARPGLLAAAPTRLAVDNVSLAFEAGRSFGVVGESGSGKSTLARAIMALDRPTEGVVRLDGRSLFDLPRRELRAMREHIQMIFQDPYGSLDPRQNVARIVAEPLSTLAGVSRAQRDKRVREALEAVGLRAADALKYPHEFSGGQRQRVAIARALITRPKLVVADEPVSALDVSIQAQVLNVMTDLQRDAGVTFFVISHDLAVVGHICDEIAVMFRGRFVETGPSGRLLSRPAHPYTRELVDAAPRLDSAPRLDNAPRLDSALAATPGTPPHPDAKTGCAYAPRCLFAQARCLEEAPALRDIGQGDRVACHFPL